MTKQTLSTHEVARNVLERIAKKKLRRKGSAEKRTEIVADALAKVFTPEALSSIGSVGFYVIPFHDALLQPPDTNGELSKSLIQVGCTKPNSKDMNLYRIFGLCKRELENAKKMRDRKDQRVIEETRHHDVQRLLTRPSETPFSGIEREERERAEEVRLEIEAAENERLRQASLDWYFSLNTSQERVTLLQLINTDLSDREINVLTGMARPSVSKFRKQLYAMADRYLTDDPSEKPVYEAPEFQLLVDNEEVKRSDRTETISGDADSTDDPADVSTTREDIDYGNGGSRKRAAPSSSSNGMQGRRRIDIDLAKMFGAWSRPKTTPGGDKPVFGKHSGSSERGRDSNGARKHNIEMMHAYAAAGDARDRQLALAEQKKQESRQKRQEAAVLDRDVFLLNLAAKHGITPQELQRLAALCEQANLSLDKVLSTMIAPDSSGKVAA